MAKEFKAALSKQNLHEITAAAQNLTASDSTEAWHALFAPEFKAKDLQVQIATELDNLATLDINAQNKSTKQTILHLLVENDQHQTLHKLREKFIAQKLDYNKTDKYGKTALFYCKSASMVEELLNDTQIDVNIKDASGNPVILYWCKKATYETERKMTSALVRWNPKAPQTQKTLLVNTSCGSGGASTTPVQTLLVICEKSSAARSMLADLLLYEPSLIETENLRDKVDTYTWMQTLLDEVAAKQPACRACAGCVIM